MGIGTLKNPLIARTHEKIIDTHALAACRARSDFSDRALRAWQLTITLPALNVGNALAGVGRCKKCWCYGGKHWLATERCQLNPPLWDVFTGDKK
jgi:hypothetical protein